MFFKITPARCFVDDLISGSVAGDVRTVARIKKTLLVLVDCTDSLILDSSIKSCLESDWQASRIATSSEICYCDKVVLDSTIFNLGCFN